jgi:putative glycosyl hydrolase-like family 6 (GHL6) protein/glycosyl hydrolase family 42 (putative beta-galactosidase)
MERMFQLALGALAVAGLLCAEQPWWEREPLRIIDLTTSVSRIDYRDPARLVAEKAELGYNAEHLEVMAMPAGLDDRGFFFKSKLASVPHPDYLRRYISEAKKRGIRVLIYFNVHYYTMRFAAEHADWREIRENGKPLDGVYDTGASFCVNTPWREWVFQVVRDLAAYPIDGIFYDGPVYRPDTCYCRYCRAKFRKRYGTDMPSKGVRTGKPFQQLLEFQADSIADFLRDTRSILKSKKSDCALYMNGGVRGANWATGRLNRVLVKEQDLLGSEGGFLGGDLTRVPLWKPGLTARLLETQSGGKPRVIFSAASHKPWTFSLLPDSELRLLYADTIANGASVWMGITPFEFEQPEMKTLAAMNRFLAKNAEYYVQTRSAARVAVVWSDVTANFYAASTAQLIDIDRIASRSQIGNVDGEFSGITEPLLRTHVPFDVLDDVALETDPLNHYEAIFLPNVACMSDKIAARLESYVRQGGNLVADFETSRYDETGIPRNNFALAEVFGANAAQKIAGPRRWDFMRSVAKSKLLDGLNREFIPSPSYYVPANLRAGHAVLQYTERLAGPYDGVPALSKDPGLVVNKLGKGHAIYFSGDLGDTITKFHTPELIELLANAGRQMAAPPVVVENAPGSVEIAVRTQNDGRRTLVHLVNFTGEMTRPIRHIVPISDVRITLASGIHASRAFTLWDHRPVPLTQDRSGHSQAMIPRLNEYDVLVFEN